MNEQPKLQLKGWLQSSQDPEKVSNTVRGGILAMSGLIIFLAQWLGFPLTETQVVTAAAELGTAAGLMWSLYGVMMKVVVAIGRK